MRREIDMVLQGRRFENVGSLHPTRRADGTVATDRPQLRYAKAGATPLHQYGDGAFCIFCLPEAPKEPGVYAIWIGDEIMYVGEAESLKQRFYSYGHISPRNCYEGGRQTNCRINKLIFDSLQSGQSVEVWFHACGDRRQFEADLLNTFRPRWNR